MREETSEQPTNFTHDAIVEDRFIGRIDLTLLIVRTVNIPVKYVAGGENDAGTANGPSPVALAPRLTVSKLLVIVRTISILDALQP